MYADGVSPILRLRLNLIKSFYFLDHILAAAMAASPHTTPAKTFPNTSKVWHESVESKFFKVVSRVTEDGEPIGPVFEFEIVKDGDHISVRLTY